ncbi:sucrose phosphorylase [Lutibacter oceani]|uniref:Sucrose phosphorylase n=1 Tax=Lutibacter oceani TaxID=1853311 RepID=A0A3D9RLC3_9FLAO|nr:sugar phosphorylase [Lutibacter oceani]REE80557.1 sucrose phosphorylase [Lutibacter oceani]
MNSFNKLDKQKLISQLEQLYKPYEVAWVFNKIETLQNKYASKVEFKKGELSQKDVILITYGDNVQKKGQPHIKTLQQFVDKYCAPEINGTHILPFYPFTSDDGFSVKDYFEVDETLGDWEAVENFSKTTKLMFDAVVNHISKSSNWFKKYLENDAFYNDFFIDVDPKTDVSKVMRPRALPLLSPFKKSNGSVKNVWTTFSEDQIDLNYASPKVFIAVLEVLLFYISKGAKFIRLDAIGFIWKKIGASCIHLPEAHLIIQLYRAIIETLTQNVYIITETNVPHQENISYFGNGFNEAQMVYNFTLPPLLAYSIMKENVSVLTRWAQSLKMPSNKVCFFNFTASHDGVGVRPLQGIINDDEIFELAKRAEAHGGRVSYKNNEDGSQSPYELNCNYMDLLSNPNENDEIRIAKMMLSQSVMLAMPGVPGIYFHSLVGSQNYYQGIESGINRRINREKLDFDTLIQNLNTKGTLRNKLYNLYKKVLAFRVNEEAFNPYAEAVFIQPSEHLFIIKRTKGGSCFYVVHNFSDNNQKMKALKNNVQDVLTNEIFLDKQWEFKPYEYKWLKVL